MKLTMIGQAPSRETDGQPPFTGKCGVFLAMLMCITQDEMLAQHEMLNVLQKWPGKGIGGDKFPMVDAKIAAKKMLPSLRNKPVILLGANVARAFGAKNFAYGQYYEIRDPEHPSDIVVPFMAVIPHPSGVNRYWNRPENRDAVRKFFVELLAKNS